MKKFLMVIAVILISAVSFGQVTINEVKTSSTVLASEPVLSDVLTHLLVYSNDFGYVLYIYSSNRYEKQGAVIMLGEDEETAIESLNNLISLFSLTNKNTYDINGYTVYGNGTILNTGKLEYTAGSYVIQPIFLKKFVKKIKNIK